MSPIVQWLSPNHGPTLSVKETRKPMGFRHSHALPGGRTTAAYMDVGRVSTCGALSFRIFIRELRGRTNEWVRRVVVVEWCAVTYLVTRILWSARRHRWAWLVTTTPESTGRALVCTWCRGHGVRLQRCLEADGRPRVAVSVRLPRRFTRVRVTGRRGPGPAVGGWTSVLVEAVEPAPLYYNQKHITSCFFVQF